MEATPALGTRSSHVPGRAARERITVEWIRRKRRRFVRVMVMVRRVGVES